MPTTATASATLSSGDETTRGNASTAAAERQTDGEGGDVDRARRRAQQRAGDELAHRRHHRDASTNAPNPSAAIQHQRPLRELSALQHPRAEASSATQGSTPT